MDHHLTWYNCCPHWDYVQWPWPGSIPQRSMSHKTFKGQSTHALVRAITYVCFDILPSNLVQMLFSLRRCAVTLTWIYKSKVKVTRDIVIYYKSMTHFPFFVAKITLILNLPTLHTIWITNKYPSITCSYIQEYLGYLSNNLYFLFFHSWQMVMYNFGQVQRTSQVERKTKCSKKNGGGYSRPLDCLD